MTGVLWEKVRTHGHVGEEAEMRVMQPRAKEQARSHQLVRGREGLSLKASEGAQPCQHLSFRIWGFGSLRINFGCVKSLSLCCCCYCCYVASVVSDSVWPHRRQPTRLPRPWDSPGKNTGVGCHFLLQCRKVKSEVAQSCLTPSDPMDCSLPGSSVHGIFQAQFVLLGYNSPRNKLPPATSYTVSSS